MLPHLTPPPLPKLSGPQVSGKVTAIYPLTDHTQLKLEAEAGTREQSVGYGLEYTINEHTKFGVFLEYVGAALSLAFPDPPCPLPRASTTEGVTVKGKFRAMRQTYVVPVFLADELLTEAVAYGTVVPVGWHGVGKSPIPHHLLPTSWCLFSWCGSSLSNPGCACRSSSRWGCRRSLPNFH